MLTTSKGTGVVAVTESLRTYGPDTAVMIQRSGSSSQNLYAHDNGMGATIGRMEGCFNTVHLYREVNRNNA